ncbi:SGNH/GDSL hydrolase family protein [Agromyces albus]|uniref:SGNH/GDSL hydrolase family protein n=1 Tax=Agromyces albus TaxID=205332 RepID=A0A4Q2L7C5_9MICO|nr:SGNH/GDSL hydrolase family protein [Agromyces albus]RXZ72201.1 SGNH/GDSL hydrolase family protein [Agromyces albus]
MPERRVRARRALAALAVLASLLLAGCFPGDTDELVPPVDGPRAGRLADYSFGHTATVAKQFADAPLDAVQRLPFTLAADATSFRVHIRNWNYLTDEPVPGALEITGVWMGPQGDDPGSSAYAEKPAYLAEGGTITDGATYTSPWISASDVPLDAATPMLLSVGLRADTGIPLAVTGGVSWLDLLGASKLGGAEDALGTWNPSASLLDIWIEHTVAPETPVLFSIGHSLNAPGNVDPVASPHEGEITSWPQQWARAVGGVASTLAVSGAWTTSFGPQSPKWMTYGNADPDYVSIWSSSSDLASGRSLVDVQASMKVLVDRARKMWPEARIIGFTEPPRSNSADVDVSRTAYNVWMRTKPLGIDAVVDADAALTDRANPLALEAGMTADGAHFNAAGHELMAKLFTEAVDALEGTGTGASGVGAATVTP